MFPLCVVCFTFNARWCNFKKLVHVTLPYEEFTYTQTLMLLEANHIYTSSGWTSFSVVNSLSGFASVFLNVLIIYFCYL